MRMSGVSSAQPDSSVYVFIAVITSVFVFLFSEPWAEESP